MGDNCFWQPRNIPPEAKRIKLHNKVIVASEVLFVNHDAMRYVFQKAELQEKFSIYMGAIEVGNNVFIGSRSVICPGIKIEDNVIARAGV